MEVVLRKTKITSSIFKQMLLSKVSDFEDSECLGWCYIPKSLKYMVLYNQQKQSLSCFPMFEGARVEEQKSNNTFWVVVSLGGNWTDKNFSFENIESAEKFANTLKTYKNRAYDAGQFFL